MSDLLKAGDIIEILEGHTVYADVPDHFVYTNRKGNFKDITHSDVLIGGDLSYLAGRYIVINTTEDGGGYGHGPGDIYSNGHHVFCVREGKEEIKIDFFQTGCFTAMIKDIKPVGRAKLVWKTNYIDA